MAETRIQLNDVIYNAGTQSFEALVCVGSGDAARRYACSIEAPITMSYAKAAEGLKTQALRRHGSRGGLSSRIRRQALVHRAGRAAFDPRRWLAQIGLAPRSDAA